MSNLRVAERPATRVERPLSGKGHTGLCSTCLHAPECIFLARATEPVVYCEEFMESARLPSPTPEAIQVSDRKQRVGSPVVAEEGIALNGLCVNCTKKNECLYRKSGENIWYCEEHE